MKQRALGLDLSTPRMRKQTQLGDMSDHGCLAKNSMENHEKQTSDSI